MFHLRAGQAGAPTGGGEGGAAGRPGGGRVCKLQLQLAQIKQEIHRKISEKEEEFVHYFSVCRKNLSRAMALMLGVRAECQEQGAEGQEETRVGQHQKGKQRGSEVHQAEAGRHRAQLRVCQPGGAPLRRARHGAGRGTRAAED